MWRYFVGSVAAVLMGVAAMLLFRSSAASEPKLPAAPAALMASEEPSLPDEVPSATARTREQKRFDRIDKDKDDAVTREEYLLTRRKAFARLDRNGDGRLDFEEWAVKTTEKFAGADKDKSGVLTRTEFATTAVIRKPKPKCACAPAAKPAPKDQSSEADSSEDGAGETNG